MDRRDFILGAVSTAAATVIPAATPPIPETARVALNRALASPAQGLLVVRPLKDTEDDICFAGELTPATIQYIEVKYPSQVYIVADESLITRLREDVLPSNIFESATIICGPLGKPFLCLSGAHLSDDFGWVIGYDLA